MEFDMATMEGRKNKKFDEEFNTDRDITKGHIASHGIVRAPRLWICGGYNQDEFKAFIHQWSLYRECYSRMDDRELRYQLLDSINGPLEDAMYDAFGGKIYTISDATMLEELEKFAVKEIIVKSVNYSTKVSEENPVMQPQVHSSQAQRSPAHSKSKEIAVKQPLAHSSQDKQPPAKLKPPDHAQAVVTLGLPREDKHGHADGGGAKKVHLYTIPARRPAPRTGMRRLAQDLAPEDQHQTWRKKTSTDLAQKTYRTEKKPPDNTLIGMIGVPEPGLQEGGREPDS
jgi:hypothetical protein